MLERRQAAVLEALLDERLSPLAREGLPAEALAQLAADGLLDEVHRGRAIELLEPWRRGREIEWATHRLTQGDLLDAFAEHCESDLDEVEVLERRGDVLVARWRRETSRIELRAGFVGFEGVASATPTMLLGDVEGDSDRLVAAFLDDEALRSRLAICDVQRLERLGTVRSSVFVYLEWFLRDAYGVKLLPASAFTQGLIDRGVISLGMG
ncbi:MAG TPA: hypothetical protein VH572_08675 [Gaiella sp.]|jgi:hypothetical protein